MNADQECEHIHCDLPGYRAGWLTASRVTEVARHLAGCHACSACQHRDERLVHAIETLEPVTPPEADWAHVLASRRVRQHPVSVPWRPRLALAAALIAVALGGLRLHTTYGGHEVSPVTAVAPPTVVDSGSFVVAHNSLSWGEMAGDPNRAIMLATVAQGREGTR
jgi:anti-sigma factor RsiW